MARVLVIDDEESIRFTFESFLSDEGYAVITAKDYDEALNRISSENFDLIFADILLGDRSGIDILREIRKRKLTCPVIMITGYPNVETASDAVRIGAFDYLPKPVRQENLLHVARMAFQHKTLQEENEKYRSNLEAIFRSVNDAIITVDKSLSIIEVNKAAEKVCGLDRGYIGNTFSEISRACSRKCLDALQETISTQKAVEVFRAECGRTGLSRQVVSINASPLLDSNKAFLGAVMVIKDETRLNDLERDLKERQQFHKIVGQSGTMQGIYSLIEDLADVQTTVLITGESGTGKELVAEAIHYSGSRSNKPLVKVNCSALTENLLESELFGHVKGAFTGADRDKVGRFQKADGGTIFLDEIGDISPRMQLRLLRVLQEKVFERVGDSTPVKADVRVIAATNQDLQQRVQRGKMREDLYYRLKVVEISMPPLRERTDDIPFLTSHFIKKMNVKFSKNIESISEDVNTLFMDYSWPGNIRELEHALEHAFIICRQGTITIDHLPQNFKNLPAAKILLPEEERNIGKERLLQALKKSGWNKSKAARMLDVNVRTIYRKLEKYDLKEPDQ
jgi:PAS domain S-box-containing protein